MVLISFKVFKDKVISGEKTRTMRAVIMHGKLNKKWAAIYERWLRNKKSLQKTLGPTDKKKIYIPIPLQIWWKSRSPLHVCSHCGFKKKLSIDAKDLNVSNEKERVYNYLRENGKFKIINELICTDCQGTTWNRESEFLFNAVITNFTKKKLRELTKTEIKADGFTGEGHHDDPKNPAVVQECMEWFSDTYYIPLFTEEDEYGNMYYTEELLNFEIYIIEFRRVD